MSDKTCPESGNPLAPALIPFEYHGDYWGRFPGLACEKEHRYFNQEGSEAIEAVAKEKDVWGKNQYG